MSFLLTLQWQKDFDWFFSSQHQPVIIDNQVIARCGEKLVWLDAGTGDMRNVVLIDAKVGDGSFFVGCRNILITEYRRRPERLSTIVMYTQSGTEIARIDLPAIVAHGNTTVIDDLVYILGIDPNQGQMLYVLDPARGVIEQTFMLQWGGNALIPLGNDLVIRNQTASDTSPGLYCLDKMGDPINTLLTTSVWLLRKSDSAWFVIARRTMDRQRDLHVYTADSFNQQWSALVLNEAGAIDSDRVYAVTGPENGMVTAFDVLTGSILWQSTALDKPVSRMESVGGYLFCKQGRVMSVYSCIDGSLIGQLDGYFGPPTLHNGRYYIGGKQSVFCLV